MKTLLAALSAVSLMAGMAYAGESEGSIQSVNPSDSTMTLSDGVTYKLPTDFDVSLIGEGMRVAIAFDEVGDDKVVTDMEQID